MTQNQCTETINALREKNDDLVKLLDQFTQEKKQIGRVVSGPHQDEDKKNYYRVSLGGDECVVHYDQPTVFVNNEIQLEPGAEVAVIKGSIVGVLPQKLLTVTEEPEFNFVQWDEIGGLKSQIQRIREAIEMPLHNAELMAEFGLEPIKGILLYGPPGCGKTLIARAIASTILSHTKAKSDAFVYLKGGEMLSMYVGATEQHVGRIFKQCRAYAKKHNHRAIIFIDEAEALLPVRGSRKSSDVETTIVPTFLSEMDGFDGMSPIVILSTNFPESIDSAVLREGRIDIKIPVQRPSLSDAVDIFKIHLKKVKTLDDVATIAQTASETIFRNGLAKRMSGSLIQTVVKLSTQTAASRYMSNKKGKRGVTTDDVVSSISLIDTN